MKIFLALFIIPVLLVVAAAVFLWSGSYNVAATLPHWKITQWILEEVRERSISVHSRGIIAPPLDNPKLVLAGFKNYHEMCRLCHGAPGEPRTEIAKGLYPAPPDLTKREEERPSDAEFFWIIKNGIKMTGMPAFGPTHREDEIWGIVAFLRRLPNLKPKEYNALVKAAGLQIERENDRHHGHKPH